MVLGKREDDKGVAEPGGGHRRSGRSRRKGEGGDTLTRHQAWGFLHASSFKELSRVMGQVLLFTFSKMRPRRPREGLGDPSKVVALVNGEAMV